MKYVFIGSDSELKRNAFRLVNDYEVYAIRNEGSCNTFINNDKEIVCWNEKYIKDLLKQGLVIKKGDE